MDWKTFIVYLIQILVWPSLVALFLLVQQESIARLINRLTNLKWSGAEASFERELSSLETKISSGIIDPSPLAADILNSPKEIIQNSWANLESSLDKIANDSIEQTGSSDLSPHRPKFSIGEAVADLKVLRDKALSEGNPITQRQAVRFKRLSNHLMSVIRS